MSDSTYVCARCGGTFEDHNRAEANDEAKKLWGVDNASERPTEFAVVCDDCFAQFMAWYKARSC